jgi:hypothetical protein
MGVWDNLANMGMGMLGGVANMALGKKTMDMQLQNQKELNEHQQQMQLDMWDKTNYKAQVEQMKKAGLNVGLMYEGGGQGGSTQSSVGGSAQGMQSPDIMGMLLDAKKLQSEIELNEAQANKIASETPTEGQNIGNVNLEETRQKAIALAEDNEVRRFMREGAVDEGEVEMRRNKNLNYSYSKFDELSPKVKEFNAELFKLEAEKKNLDANALLTNEKAKGYWNELIIATKNADANMINAKANELAKEWETGEFTNWRTWVEIAKDAVGMGTDIVKTRKLPNKK